MHYRNPRRRKRDKGTLTLFKEITSENILNLAKEMDIKIQRALRLPNKMDSQRPKLSLMIIDI